jgi:hypothetical protein
VTVETAIDPVSPPPGQRLAVGAWLPPAGAALIAAVVFTFARRTLVDDAYITLDYARNLAFHLHWGLIQAVTANTATSPLHVLLLGVLTLVTRRPVLALGILYVLSSVALEVGLRRAARSAGLPGWIGLLAVGLTAVNPLLISSIGLEIALGGGLIALLFAVGTQRRPWLFGVLSGLLVLVRPDLLIVALVVFGVRPDRWQGWWRSVLACVAVVLPWYLWSWIALGSALPDTLLLKLYQGGWAGHRFGTGPVLYETDYPSATVLAFLPAALGAFAALCWLVVRVARPTDRLRRLDRFAALPVAGVLHYLAYTVLSVPPYHWYYGTSILCCTAYLAAVAGAAFGPAESPLAARLPAFGGATLVAAIVVASVVNYAGAGLPRSDAQFSTNWASSAQYAVIGTDVRRLAGNRPVEIPGELGAIAYFCDCEMLNVFSDRGLVVQTLPFWLHHGSTLTRLLLRWNFHFLDRAQRPVAPRLLLTYSSAPPARALGTWRVSSPWTDRPGHWHYVALLPHA